MAFVIQFSLLLWVGLTLSLTAFAQEDSPSPPLPTPTIAATQQLPETVVTATRMFPEGAPLDTEAADTSPQARSRAADSAALLREVPGAAVVRNGPQTGIVQLRGLSGDRVKVLVDGMTITPACPNHMDPPLHYAAPSGADSLTVMAGITPVSLGGDSIGGTVLLQSPPTRFSTNDHPLAFGEIGTVYRSSNDGYGFSGGGGLANRTWSAAYQGSWQTAGDLRFPGGRVRDTGYHTQQHGLVVGLQTDVGLWSIDASLLRTRDTGTPALPMDMIKDDGYGIGLTQSGHYSFGSVDARFYYHATDHRMDNYSLHPVATGGMRMFSPSNSDDTGLNLGVSLPHGIHTLRVGTEFHLNDFDAYQQNVATGAQQDTLNDASRVRAGTYVEWQADWSTQWTTLLGLRNDTVRSDAANVSNFYPPSAADAAEFNARPHDLVDVNFDVTAAVRFAPNTFSAYELALARKNRAPSLLERYLWTPLSASAGQADGRTYLGNLDLGSETSHQIAATADWYAPAWEVMVTPFYNFVTGYIQGTPIARLDSKGQPVLQYQNVGRADLYGVDGKARYAFNEHFALRGVISYVRGIDRDNGDNLYRIAPLHGAINLDHHLGGWESNIELRMVRKQDKVARYNDEPRTPGYALLNLRTGYTFPSRIGVQVGIENMLDKRYADHLGGINRVLSSDVEVGERIPGAGRFVYAQASYRF